MLADDLSLESEWQQSCSVLQDSSQYSGLSQQYCTLYGLDYSPWIPPVFLSNRLGPFQAHQLQYESLSRLYSIAFFSTLARS